VRPVREQLEHDRIIRLLQAKYKRKFEVGINPGNVQGIPVGTGPSAVFPDLVLTSNERGKKLAGVVEVETVESVNHLEAMSQWAGYSRLRTAFHLYIPGSAVDVARRFCQDMQISVTELWAYTLIGDQFRFSLVQKVPSAGDSKPRPTVAPATARKTKASPPPRKAAAAAARGAAPAKGKVLANKDAGKKVSRATAPASASTKKAAKGAAAKKVAGRPLKRR
jgi:hypothetical protein